MRWRILLDLDIDLSNASLIIQTCCVLHNICIDFNDQTDIFNENDENDENETTDIEENSQILGGAVLGHNRRIALTFGFI